MECALSSVAEHDAYIIMVGSSILSERTDSVGCFQLSVSSWQPAIIKQKSYIVNFYKWKPIENQEGKISP